MGHPFCFFSKKKGTETMNEEKKPEGKIVLQGKTFSWLENFWYHYKWVTIGVAFAVIVLLVCILQICSKEKQDTIVVYAGPTYLSTSQTEQLTLALQTVVPRDFDGDGEKNLAMSLYEIYSEEQIRAIHSAGEKRIDTSRNSDQYQLYTTYQQTGESSIYLLDPWLYQSMDKNYLCPIAEAVGEGIAAKSADGYGVRLGDTALYEEYAVLRLLPEDTVICLMRPLVWGASSDEDAYAFEQEMFAAMIPSRGEENS